jgi:hypothetical protein
MQIGMVAKKVDSALTRFASKLQGLLQLGLP